LYKKPKLFIAGLFCYKIIEDMNKKYILYFAGFLFLLNIFCWREVFVLASNNDLKVIFFDVGQGDSIFIETPQKHQILIDGGPSSAVLQKLSERMPFWDKNIDLIILTHPDKDHYFGIMEVLKRYKVDYVLWTGVVKNSSDYGEWINLLEEKQKRKTKVLIAESGQIIKAGDALMNILYPFENVLGQEIKDVNDTSVVARLSFFDNSFLFVGDISSKIEKKLVQQKNNLFSDILKVGHHGSKYSTSEIFLENVLPEFAVISVGKNSYGHPTPEVLEKLNNIGAEVLRTDQKGDITILLNEKNIIIK
jgi:competence protein ComEC